MIEPVLILTILNTAPVNAARSAQIICPCTRPNAIDVIATAIHVGIALSSLENINPLNTISSMIGTIIEAAKMLCHRGIPATFPVSSTSPFISSSGIGRSSTP